ncbi:hypothetical protein UFOVP671_12 [uncultured Caudovirales phage]|uniref:Uncharacterized protein n=1 Tax=uncultured Caudovirales phage TaxID=2100421 RepID=A0A6J5NDA9_9CAUD|nr:hypothetical protein UFOVP671_12 [uncultured Caudovirales phage]
MATYNKYLPAVGPLLKAITLATDTWKIALATTVTNTDTSFTPGTTDLATSGGYTAGGNSAAVTSSTVTSGTLNLVLADPATWTASGGGFTFRYVILWNATNSIPVGYWDYGSSVVMNGTNADTFTVSLDGTNGVFSVT